MCQDQHVIFTSQSHKLQANGSIPVRISISFLCFIVAYIIGKCQLSSMYQHKSSFCYSYKNYRKMAVFQQSLLFRKLCLEQKTRLRAIEIFKDFIQSMIKRRSIPKNYSNIKYASRFLSFCHSEQLSVCPRFIMIETKNKYYVMNYSINSFTGASEAPVNVVVVY